MPSPIGHGLAGLTVHVLVADGPRERHDFGRAAVVLGAALAPDLDLLLRFLDGRNHHQSESHSLGLAIAAGLVAGAAARAMRWRRPMALGLGAGLAWLSHVLLDYLARDTSPPIGVMALWPLRSDHYHFPWPLFLDIWRTLEWSTARHDALAAAWETVVLLPVLSVAWWLRVRAKD